MANDFAHRSRMISDLAETFGKSLSVGSLELYVTGTRDIPIEKFNSAIAKIIRESRFLPSIAEFREIAQGQSVLPKPDEQIAAWNQRWKGARN